MTWPRPKSGFLTSATYAVWPSGLIAISSGPGPTLIGLPALLLEARIGVTVFPALFAT